MLYSKDDNDCEVNAPVKSGFDRLPDVRHIEIIH